MSNFAKLIYELRKEKGLTQAELAEKINITDKAISKWENGESFPETAQLITLSNLFDISIDSLLKGVKEEKKETETQRFFEELKKNEKPLSRNESVIIAIAVGIILIGMLIGVSLFFSDTDLFVCLLPVIICIIPSVFLLVKMGMEKLMNDGGLDEKHKPAGRKSIIFVAVAVSILISMLIPVSYMVVNSELNIPALLIGGILLIAGCVIAIIGGTDFLREVLSNLPAKKPLKIPLKIRLISIICSVITLTAIALFLVIGFVWGAWHPAWVIFPISFLLCGIVSIIVTLK